MDIVEPENIIATTPVWPYLLISTAVLIVIFFVIRYFNIRIKLWYLSYKIDNNTKETARKILTLFKLEKNTDYIEKVLHINKNSSNHYRQKLLKACYTDKPVGRQHIQLLLKTANSWLR